MTSARLAAIAARAGAPVEYADLGAWGAAELRAEYDPSGPVIRVNARSLAVQNADERERFLLHAIAHELYHHVEARGTCACVRGVRAREAAAEAFAARVLARSGNRG